MELPKLQDIQYYINWFGGNNKNMKTLCFCLEKKSRLGYFLFRTRGSYGVLRIEETVLVCAISRKLGLG